MITGENVTIRFRQVRIDVAQVQREDLVSKGHADVPGVVFGQLNPVSLAWENGVAVERVGFAKPVVAELAGKERANVFAREPGDQAARISR